MDEKDLQQLQSITELVYVQLDLLYQTIDEEFDLNDNDPSDPINEKFQDIRGQLVETLFDYVGKYRP